MKLVWHMSKRFSRKKVLMLTIALPLSQCACYVSYYHVAVRRGSYSYYLVAVEKLFRCYYLVAV
ncbi:hypothetical protein [Thermospira aquatica]|uniref:Uncharacterized protein n=1 Tax=Thermospira aquatica TaxID=2828656 RepID=A0AAX3BED0_9SPIR|nr:hypothetical protein [Thermospira aquatica]URA10707.1 hypothetical protein KDW03_02575 [Thermospira aquatica]